MASRKPSRWLRVFWYAFADDDEIHERRHRLGVRERADAAHEDHRVVGRPLGRAQSEAAQREQAQDVDVVALVGDREADHVEVGERPLRLQRERRALRALHLDDVGGVRQEHALADHVGQRVEVPVDRLEAQVRHPHRVGVGVHECHGDLAAPVLADRALLSGEQCVSFFL
jgi:hypothetical protein